MMTLLLVLAWILAIYTTYLTVNNVFVILMLASSRRGGLSQGNASGAAICVCVAVAAWCYILL